MSEQKNKKNLSWFKCEKCLAFILHKDIENHEGFCPPNFENTPHTFVRDQVLYGILDLKLNEDVKNLSSREKDNLVFLSQSAMQLCSFSIGENVIVALTDGDVPIVQKVWPTIEKSLTSVLVTKNCQETTNFGLTQLVTVKKLPENPFKASQITLVILSGPKSLDITSELNNRISKSYLDHYLTPGNYISVMFYGSILKFQVKTIDQHLDGANIDSGFSNLSIGDNRRFYLVDSHTKWKIYRDEHKFLEENINEPEPQIAGLESEIGEIRELLTATLRKSKINTLNLSKSVLLYGNSGTGKTTLAKMLAKELKVNIVEIYAPDLYSKYSGSLEDGIKELFQSAVENCPSIVILDEVDILCPTRNGRITDSEKRIVSTMLTCIDDLTQSRLSKVFIIATTNKIDNIDPAFRRCGRLDREIEIPTPNPKSRQLILQKFLNHSPHELSDSDFKEIARTTHGYVGADLVSLCSQASLNCVRRMADKMAVEDFKMAMRKVRPSAMREVQVEVPNVKWSDIGGQDNLKLILRQAVEWPLKYADSFVRLGVTPPKGVLMFGPPGCSKTMIAKALATESGLNFLSIKVLLGGIISSPSLILTDTQSFVLAHMPGVPSPELFSKWVGESEKAIREVFRKARQVAPSIVFFDEIDALGGERSSGSSTSVQERVLAQLLTELDGVTPLGDVTILAATNRPDKIDKALLRPGRLDRIVYVPLPDDGTRKEIFRIKLDKMPTKDVSVEDLVKSTKGYSGAEVNAVCHEAAMMALEEDLQIDCVENRHFEKALRLVTPRTPHSLIKLYEDYMNLKI